MAKSATTKAPKAPASKARSLDVSKATKKKLKAKSGLTAGRMSFGGGSAVGYG